MSFIQKRLTRPAAMLSAIAATLCLLSSPVPAATPPEGKDPTPVPLVSEPSDVKQMPRNPQDVQAAASWLPIRNYYTRRCLAIQAANTAPAQPVFQYNCLNYYDQKWALEPVGAYGDYRYRIKNLYNGKCLSVQEANPDPSKPAFGYACHDVDDQLWEVTDWGTSSGVYLYSTLKNSAFREMCLAVQASNDTNGAPAFVTTCNWAYNDQKWEIRG